MIIHRNMFAVIFPGQSSQHLGMLSDLFMHYKLVRETFSEVSEILGYDIWKLIQNGPINKLNQTCYSQPAILTSSVAIWRIWKEQGGLMPNIMAGHSLGEYSALVCSGSMDLLSAAKLVMFRGTLMQKIVPYECGAMSVIIGLGKDIILKLCDNVVRSSFNQIVSPASFNSLDNIVISGHKEAVNKVNLLCKNAGAKYISILPISVPSHCILMKSMINEFREELEKIFIKPPIIPIINNTDVYIEKNPNRIRDALIRQLYTPVRWSEIMQEFINQNIKHCLEMGPDQVLTRLIRRSSNNLFSLSINNVNSLLKAINIYSKLN